MKIAKKSRRGQNTAEYLIMLTLVVIGSIGLWTAFGKTIHGKIAYVSAALSGRADLYTRGQGTASGAAAAAITQAQAADNIRMEGIAVGDLRSQAITEDNNGGGN